MTSKSSSTTSTAHGAAASPAKAHRAVQTMLALDRDVLQVAFARTVAAMLHDGTGTALERFAVTGDLDAEAILDELDRVEVPFEEEAWVDALARFVLFTSGGRS